MLHGSCSAQVWPLQNEGLWVRGYQDQDLLIQADPMTCTRDEQDERMCLAQTADAPPECLGPVPLPLAFSWPGRRMAGLLKLRGSPDACLGQEED